MYATCDHTQHQCSDTTVHTGLTGSVRDYFVHTYIHAVWSCYYVVTIPQLTSMGTCWYQPTIQLVYITTRSGITHASGSLQQS